MIAPEVMVEVGKRRFNKPSIDYQKAEIFSLGIVCLYMTTLIHPREFKLYNFDEYVVMEEHLKEYLAAFNRLNIY